MGLFQFAYFIFLVFGLSNSLWRRTKNKGPHRGHDGPNSCIIYEGMQTQKNIHILVIILRLWWHLISQINLGKSE